MTASTFRVRPVFKFTALGLFLFAVGCHTKLTTNGSAASSATTGTPPADASAPLSANDVSWLFPAPTTAADMANLIAVKDITTASGPVWTDAVFQQFVGIANSNATLVDGSTSHISLPKEAQSIDAWFVAGVRIDAGAPGLSKDIATQYGQLPEIRLIIQPIVKNPDGSPKVLDIAGHLIFDFISGADPSLQGTECRMRPTADMAAFSAIVDDAAALRTKLASGHLGGHSVSTSGVALGVHPGLMDPATANAMRNAMLALLQSRLSAQRLDAMAIAGLPANAPAPWIFLSLLVAHPGQAPGITADTVVPVNGPTLDGTQFAQMLNPGGVTPRVVPEPHTNNLNPITCRNAAASPTSLPVAQRKGVSTSTLFGTAPAPTAAEATPILDTIADPQKSFFFNTDCISCHTETQRTMTLVHVTNIPGINPAVLPSAGYDVRNFGWGEGKNGIQATVTRRAANETAAVVNFVNSNVLSKKN